MDREQRHGFDTYRVRVLWSRPDDIGVSEYTDWFDVRSLGMVGQRGGDFAVSDSQPLPLLYPLMDKAYVDEVQATVTGQPSFNQTFNVTVHVGAWSQVQVPAGRFSAVDVAVGGDVPPSGGWFAPAVGNYVRFFEDGTNFHAHELEFSLQAWSKR
jgi:hypothetical protein